MIGLDTNVIVRYLTQDDAIQSAKAARLIARSKEHDPAFISVIAITETAWVLERVYGFSDAAIAAAIEGLLAADALLVECEQQVFEAAATLKDGRGSFADALIGALGTKPGSPGRLRSTVRRRGFEVLPWRNVRHASGIER